MLHVSLLPNFTLVSVFFRFLSIPKGFSYLNERGYVSKQLDKWQKVLTGRSHSAMLILPPQGFSPSLTPP